MRNNTSQARPGSREAVPFGGMHVTLLGHGGAMREAAFGAVGTADHEERVPSELQQPAAVGPGETSARTPWSYPRICYNEIANYSFVLPRFCYMEST